MVDANQWWRLNHHPSNDWKFWVATKKFPSNVQNIWLPKFWPFNLVTKFFMCYLEILNNNWKYFGQQQKNINKKSCWINGGDPTIANKTTKFFGQHPKPIWAMTKKIQSLDLVTERWQPKKFQLRFFFSRFILTYEINGFGHTPIWW